MKDHTYPSDVTDAQWAIIEPMIPRPGRGGRPRTVPMREVIDAIFSLNRSGCPWRMLPGDFPPWSTVYHYFRLWKIDGTWQRLHDALRQQVRDRETDHPPRTASIDRPSVKTTEVGGERGFDAGKLVNGRKRHLVVDSCGLLLAVLVTAACVPEAVAAQEVLKPVTARRYPNLEVLWGDKAYER